MMPDLERRSPKSSISSIDCLWFALDEPSQTRTDERRASVEEAFGQDWWILVALLLRLAVAFSLSELAFSEFAASPSHQAWLLR